jgi:hypothetical protein
MIMKLIAEAKAQGCCRASEKTNLFTVVQFQRIHVHYQGPHLARSLWEREHINVIFSGHIHDEYVPGVAIMLITYHQIR